MPLARYSEIDRATDEPTNADAGSVDGDALAHRYGLLLLSLIAIAALAGSPRIIAFIRLITVASYCALIAGAHLIRQSENPERLRLWLQRGNWGLWIGLFAALEMTGAVGTLTGNSATLVDQWAVTLGLPFYVLSMSAANSEVLSGQRARPPLSLYLLYITYVPKFLSGPIERPAFLDALARFRFTVDLDRFDRGGRWILLGVFYKFLVGRYLARFYFPDVSDDTWTVAVGVIAFELRVYFDLCGYSLIAFGASLILGLELTLNFRHPFFAGNVRDFWRCWHISLGRWFHEYVYEPFRRSQPNRGWLICAPVIVFMASAAWHGMSFNFLLWGLFHSGAFLVYCKLFRHRDWPKAVGIAAFLGVLLFGRLLFMDSDLARLAAKLAALIDPWQWSTVLEHPAIVLAKLGHLVPGTTWLITLTCVVFALATEWQNVRRGMAPYSLFFGGRLYLIVIALVLLGTSGVEGMIYARQ